MFNLCKWYWCFILKCVHNGNADLKWIGLNSTLTCYHNTSSLLFKPYLHWGKVKYYYICLFSINKTCGVLLFVCNTWKKGMFTSHIHVPYRSALASAHQGQPLPKTLSVMESTPQVRGMHTIIRYDRTVLMLTLQKHMNLEFFCFVLFFVIYFVYLRYDPKDWDQ